VDDHVFEGKVKLKGKSITVQLRIFRYTIFMQAPATIFVTGATGNQGGAVVRHLLGKGIHIKALTRDEESEKAQQLRKLGVEVIRGNLDEPTSFNEHLKNVDGVFSVQSREKGAEREIRQGINLVDCANENNIAHIIYSSTAGASSQTGIAHFESKRVIEEHIKKTGLRYTIIRPSSLYENFLVPQVKNRLLKGKLVYPVSGNTVQQFIAADDVGKIVVNAFMNPASYTSRIITLAAEQLTIEEASQVFSEVLNIPVKYQQLPGIITRLAMGKDLHAMFKWINSRDAIFTDLQKCKRENPGLLDLKTWIRNNFQKSQKEILTV